MPQPPAVVGGGHPSLRRKLKHNGSLEWVLFSPNSYLLARYYGWRDDDSLLASIGRRPSIKVQCIFILSPREGKK